MHSHTVTVSFNEISSSPMGILSAKVTKCGLTVMATYTIKLIPKPVFETLNQSDCSEIEELDTKFTLTSFGSCFEKAVTLTISEYNPENQYEWIFNGTSFIADSKHTKIQFTQEGNYAICLRVTTPYGCMYEPPVADRPTAIIYKANFSRGIIMPYDRDFCKKQIRAVNICPIFWRYSHRHYMDERQQRSWQRKQF